ncbi:hypothetical protein JJL56_02170 [Azospirillum sp. YIM DDC1]|uniref:MarR family transcriptional regulator n=1 Tax=Azospirillum aestuarii TaxID=2802052 RepID=A0ABS1HS61_9PROT|nr:hypothetical protein [Azospirillum aestuarii]MBK4717666.1 hypothetical protein [Azospirillum aestuarii]
MRLTLADIVTSLDRDEPVHLARMLVLLLAFSRPDDAAIHGITKLAKLDFLLRYPSYFERAMVARGVAPERVPVEPYERRSVEATMVRYRFGPWDHRYRRFINILSAKGLARVDTDGRAIRLSLTARGMEVAAALAKEDATKPLAARARMLRQRIDIGATDIMKFIYATFPEIATLAYDEAITP